MANASARRQLLMQRERFVALLESWDDDGDGCISAKEFRDGCRVLLLDAGLRPPREALDELYDECDAHGTRNITLAELANALRSMPMPQLEVDVEVERTPDRRTQRRSKSLPSSPTTSPRPMRPPVELRRPSLPDISSHSPSARRAGSTSLDASPAGWRALQFEPPRHTNLPHIGESRPSGPRSVAAASHMSGRSGRTHLSGRSACSTSTKLSPEERVARQREQEAELRRRLERRKLPGFNTPGVGQYAPRWAQHESIGMRVAAARTKGVHSAWSTDLEVQHPMKDKYGRIIDVKRKTHVGDPGKYVSHTHEMAHRPTGISAVGFYSATPQRPV